MSLDFFIRNPHLVPFFLIFFVGAALLLVAPFLYRMRTKKVILTPMDLTRYSGKERKILILGIVFVFLGIFGALIMSQTYGYRIVVTDIHGNKRIETIK